MSKAYLWIYLAKGCNLRCRYCYQMHASDLMSISTGKATVTWLLESMQGDMLTAAKIFFYGGEPLLNFDVLKAIVDYSETLFLQHKKEISFYLITNGTLITKDILAFLNSHKFGVQISIDGHPDTHNRYRLTASGAGAFEKIGVDLGLNEIASNKRSLASMVVCPATVDNLSANIRYLHKIGFQKILFTPALEENQKWDESKISDFRDQIKKTIHIMDCKICERQIQPKIAIQPIYDILQNIYSKSLTESELVDESKLDNTLKCNAGRTNYTIDYQGDIYPCSRIVDDVNVVGKKYYRIGNVHLGIWDFDKLNEFKSFLPRRDENCKCSTCEIKYICPYQCFGLFKGIAGHDTDRPSSTLCSAAKVIFEESTEYLGKLF